MGSRGPALEALTLLLAVRHPLLPTRSIHLPIYKVTATATATATARATATATANASVPTAALPVLRIDATHTNH